MPVNYKMAENSDTDMGGANPDVGDTPKPFAEFETAADADLA